MLEKITDQVYDTNYTAIIRQGGYPVVDRSNITVSDHR